MQTVQVFHDWWPFGQVLYRLDEGFAPASTQQ